MSRTAFPQLLSGISVGGLELANRLVMSPMEVDFGSPEGEVTARTIDHYRERAKGGVGLVIVEATCVEAATGRLGPHQLVIDSDRGLAGFRRLARAVRRAGARVLLQLHHGGRKTTSLVTGAPPVAPSAIVNHFGETPRELDGDEIRDLVERFAEAAARARMASFDGVELHAAHGYLLSQFLSPTYNRRRDAYGGSVENRARFLLEVVAAVKRRVGNDFPLFCRLSAVEYRAEDSIRPLADGVTLEQSLEVAGLLERAGVHALDVSATLVGEAAMHPMSWPEGFLLPLAAAIKKGVSIPVIASGRIPPELGERTLAAGEADLIAMGRALLADPCLPRKLAQGRPRDIRPCIFCPVCLDPVLSSSGARCAVNPSLGHERQLRPRPAASRKRVWVVGGGPGGMEAARVARLCGHRVVLCEEGEVLGGELLLGSPFRPVRAALDRLRRYLIWQIDQLGIDVRLGVRSVAELVGSGLPGSGLPGSGLPGSGLPADERPDAVVLATPGEPETRELPGADGEHVLTAASVLGGAATGDDVAVVGGEFLGCEAALYLAEEGKRVALLTRRPRAAMGVTRAMAGFFLRELQRRDVALWTRVRAEEISPSGVLIRDRHGERRLVAASTVVLATGGGVRPTGGDRGLGDRLRDCAPQTQILTVAGGFGPEGLTRTMDGGYRAGLAVARDPVARDPVARDPVARDPVC
jgi:2,4-dienoyl-CoA reductase-like NADH-dependent reductase (Old Yellow Enzyme family)/thioredoxin reductase